MESTLINLDTDHELVFEANLRQQIQENLDSQLSIMQNYCH